MSQEGDTVNQEGQTVAEVDRIRDIIFGPQMRNYEQQFKRIVAQVDRLGKQLEDLSAALEQQKEDQEARTRQAEEDLRQSQAQSERALSSRQEQLETNLDQQVTELKSDDRKLAADLKKQAKNLRSEFTEAVRTLEDDKANRLDLSDLLIEMGTRLKQQVGLADLLGQLEDVAKD